MKKVSVHCSHVGHGFGVKQLFEDITATIHPWDRVVIVGDNGSWKSTLLHILAKKIEPDQGSVQYSWTAGVLTQDIATGKNETIEEYFKNILPDIEDRQIAVACNEVNLESDPYVLVHTLSWGQQTKLRLAVLLAQDADILLLDEPTNHLDAEQVDWLVKRIHAYKWAIICVSHDRSFIDEIATQIFDLRFGSVEIYAGNYSKYMEQRQERAEKQLQNYRLQQREKEKREKWLAEIRQRASVSPNPALGKLLRAKVKQYERTFVENAKEKPKKDTVMTMWLAWGKHGKKRLLHLAPQMVWYNDRCLFTVPALTVRGKDKVLLQWPNGSGKSTLLKTLRYSWEEYAAMEHIQDSSSPYISWWPDMHCMYLDQHNIAVSGEEQVYKRCSKNFPEWWDETHIRSKLTNAWIPLADTVRKMNELSYGQRIKVRFIQLMAHAYDMILLDEPTNHLDITTREVLEEMLQKYDWAFILVSHDRRFVQQIGVTQVRDIEGKELMKTELF